jgi:hypothetical protein
MILVKEHMGNPMYEYTCAYDDITFKCPMCGALQQLSGGTLTWCLDCHVDILDIGELIDDDEYRIKFHLGFIGYDGEEEKCQLQ